jgi:DNA-binding NtrC family response regulator
MSKAKILVIDDEDQLRKALSRIIELEGYEVLQAENGTKGIKLFESNNDIFKRTISFSRTGNHYYPCFTHFTYWPGSV